MRWKRADGAKPGRSFTTFRYLRRWLLCPRIRQHRERQAQLEAAVVEARASLMERRKILDRVETIATFAKE